MQLSIEHLKDLDKSMFQFVTPTPLKNPKIVSLNDKLAKQIGIYDDIHNPNFKNIINAQIIPDGSNPYSFAYSGHQFGYFVPNLGDGRAINLGAIDNFHLQLKGAGLTPFSRDADGRAVLRSSIREYLMSEAMYGLNIPTTRALGIISSDTNVYRGYINAEIGSIVLRVSSSWIRFGSFEYAYMGKNKLKNLQILADYVIKQSYPELIGLDDRYERLYESVVDKTIELLALWQSVGFMHGVMNTDNMSIEGLTIDYGPYAFMERFNPQEICNLSDKEGRYSFENQPFIARWNLEVLAKVLSPIVDEDILLNYLQSFIQRFKNRYFDIISQKLGLYKKIDDRKLISKLFSTLKYCQVDYTSFFYKLSCGEFSDIVNSSTYPIEMQKWLDLYITRLDLEEISAQSRYQKMREINPKYILRNYMLQEAIDLAQNGDYTLVNTLLGIAQNPYDEHTKWQRYTQPSPESFDILKCSCSS
jgi:uncharacterized protein YdiU (UPF0061 family)